MPKLFNNPWKNKDKNTNQHPPPLYGNAYEADVNISLDSYNRDNDLYGSHEQPLYKTNEYNQLSYYQQSYHLPPSYSNENPWDSVTPQNMATYPVKSPKAPKKESTHIPFLEHRQGAQDAYPFSYTAYGSPPLTPKQTTTQRTNSIASQKWSGQPYQPPNKWRYLGFAAGASPYSGEPVPFPTTSCFYYLYAISIISIIWSLFHVLFYFYRRITRKQKFNRVILFSIDLLLATLWGIGLIIEAVKYKCTDGGKFCAFYNVSLFWGFFSFAIYIISTGWDIFGACNQRH
ncbi:hypothetical protein K501DRAFT_294102 [Backusella circina FSU 941]|nr:hypothetical protein K501DRAFT_294102 [Backusella circina FSU 941]